MNLPSKGPKFSGKTITPEIQSNPTARAQKKARLIHTNVLSRAPSMTAEQYPRVPTSVAAASSAPDASRVPDASPDVVGLPAFLPDSSFHPAGTELHPLGAA